MNWQQQYEIDDFMLEEVSDSQVFSDMFIEQEINSFSFQNIPVPGFSYVFNPSMFNFQRNRDFQYRDRKQVHEQYINIRKNPIRENKLCVQEPHIKITVIKTNNQYNQSIPTCYFINSQGLVGSQKNTDSEDIIIGRSEHIESLSGEQATPNDIVLPEQERTISRIHCKIISKNFFQNGIIIKPLYAKALSEIKLPKFISLRIQKFLQEPKICQIQDIGSVFGTLIKVDKNFKQKVEQQQYFSIGSDTSFTIMMCHTPQEGSREIDQDFNPIMKIIASVLNVHGLKCNLKQDQDQNIKTKYVQDYLNSLKVYKIPFLLLKFNGSGIAKNQQELFIGTDTFYIGRGGNDSQVQINSNTISRKQTRFQFIRGAWYVADGCPEKESSNGTWFQLQTTDEKENQLESKQFPLKNLDEVKISDYILKIEFIKPRNHKQMSKRLIKEIITTDQ